MPYNCMLSLAKRITGAHIFFSSRLDTSTENIDIGKIDITARQYVKCHQLVLSDQEVNADLVTFLYQPQTRRFFFS